MVRVHGPNFRSDYLRNQFKKLLGPSLGVNRMWTKKNDHPPKSECADFFSTCPKRALWKEKNSSSTIFLVLYWASLVFTSC